MKNTTGFIIFAIIGITLSMPSCKKQQCSSCEFWIKENDSLLVIIEDLRNTPEMRLTLLEQLFERKSYDSCKMVFNQLSEKYPDTEEAKVGKALIMEVEKIEEKIRQEKQRKKQLGFMALKIDNNVKVDYTTLYFSGIGKVNQVIIDRYENRYHYYTAERGNFFVTCVVKITSAIKNPELPPVLVYKLQDSSLAYVEKLKYRFYSWSDYGTYLGNYHERRNDFAYSETVNFVLYAELSKVNIGKDPLYLLVGKENCVERKTYSLDNPPVYYKYREEFNKPSRLSLEQAEKEFHLIARM